MATGHAGIHPGISADIQDVAQPSIEASPGRLETDSKLAQYSCQTCARRKVKCDKIEPSCSNCSSRGLQCLYQAPPPRRRKRQLSSDDVDEKLARYERILLENGLLPQDAQTSPSTENVPQEPVSLRFIEPHAETSKMGKVVVGQRGSRYINSITWRNLGDDEMQSVSVGEELETENPGSVLDSAGDLPPDPLTGAFMGYREDLLQYHPTHAEAMILWNIHIESVEPLCKILHIPSSTKMAEMVAQKPETASRANECVLFAVYHFAVFVSGEEKCEKLFGQARSTLMQKFHWAARQALVNASFLTTTDINVIQALVLFLLACRYQYDPSTYWILTGVAVRVAQRVGLHRDGEALGLPPYDVQLRRRLFYQLIPLDGIASQLSGTGIAIAPGSWDTKEPSNIDDNQIWPGMTTAPQEQKGATDMIFCLARACIGKFFARSMRGTATGEFQDYSAAEPLIREAESEVEERYIRYCDIVNPLHFLTIGMARSAITSMRLRTRLPRVRDQTATDAERKELFQLANKIIDTDAAAFAHTGLQRYQWHVKSFWAYGSWDSLIYVLTSLQRPGLLSRDEIDETWRKLEQVYNNHNDLLESRQALHVAFRSLTLKAWSANPPSSNLPEPGYIGTLRSRQRRQLQTRAAIDGSRATTPALQNDQASPTGPSSRNDIGSNFDHHSGVMGFDLSSDFNLDTEDWVLWDQLIKNDQAQRG